MGVCGISHRFQWLSPTPGQIPTRYSPVRRCPPSEDGFSLDLHVLGLPPAFVLSQDQTLKLKAYHYAVLDVRTSAHQLIGCSNQSKLFVASVSKDTESRQTVKLTLHYRIYILVARYAKADPSINEPNCPHISSVFHQCQISFQTKKTIAPK